MGRVCVCLERQTDRLTATHEDYYSGLQNDRALVSLELQLSCVGPVLGLKFNLLLCVCVCVFMHLLYTVYQNIHSTHRVRTFLISEDIFFWLFPHIFNGLLEG